MGEYPGSIDSSEVSSFLPSNPSCFFVRFKLRSNIRIWLLVLRALFLSFMASLHEITEVSTKLRIISLITFFKGSRLVLDEKFPCRILFQPLFENIRHSRLQPKVRYCVRRVWIYLLNKFLLSVF